MFLFSPACAVEKCFRMRQRVKRHNADNAAIQRRTLRTTSRANADRRANRTNLAIRSRTHTVFHCVEVKQPRLRTPKTDLRPPDNADLNPQAPKPDIPETI